MARSIDRLQDRTIRAKKAKTIKTGKNKGEKGNAYYLDGDGLYLQVSRTGTKSWVFRFKRKVGGKLKSRDMGLGAYPKVSLAEAREKADEARAHRDAGRDPIEERDRAAVEQKRTELQQRLAAARTVAFREFAEGWVRSNRGAWRSDKHRDQWDASLKAYVYPVIGDVPVSDITTELVLKVLEPIWTAKTVTANRVRGRIERVLAAAKTRGLRTGENPALWRGHLDTLLAKPSKIHKIEHHPAMPYRDVPAFMARLRAMPGTAARALELAVLAGGRTTEVRQAPFAEFDLEAREWKIPAERMKNEREHRVPLCDRAVAIVKEMASSRSNDFVFPGRDGGALQEMRMWLVLQELAPGF